MGQKIIPISLRLNKKKNWNSKWIVNNNEYSNLLHFDLEIKKYFQNIFNYKNLKLIDINIVKTSNNINVYVYIQKNAKKSYKLSYNKIINHLNLYYINNNIKLFIKNIQFFEFFKLRKNLKQIFDKIKKNNKINKNVKKMIYNFSYAFYTKKINIITFYIKQTLERKKTHKKFINNIDNMLQEFFKMFSNFIGYRLQFKGRLNKSKRKKKMIFQKGKIPLNTLEYDIKYHFNEFKTPSGICSIKLWVFFNPKKIKLNSKFLKKKIKIKQKIKKS
uniref:ribosomal protein S3 n=1 Tax=Phytophthora lateralis TaxID=129355 RepID=UPI00202885C2|nr:ribosomal protein S3 [Phytophthora lateralis]DAZ88415.1 TPA_asm: ribosomal protein S3 [Phytophthora lateralis]DAZ88848.1 TPA_asm: ribosomal protein S3 [Phytophthora lateralis]